MEDHEIRALVARLGRPHRSGGIVIERASVLAEGQGASDVLDWIRANGGEPEAATPPKKAGSGVHGGGGFHDRGPVSTPVPRRYVLPPGTMD